MSDGLHLELLLDVLQIVEGGRHRRDARSREADLGGRRKLVNQVRIARPLALGKDLNQMVLVVVIQMMDGVGIVPVDTEVLRRRLQARKAADCLVRVGISGRVGILGNTPDSLDGLVGGHQFLDHIHVRSGLQHRHAWE